MRRLAFVCAIVLSLMLGGCGTIIHGREQDISFTTRPPGAQVVYDGAVRGETPCKVSISRRPLKSVVVFKKEGFQPHELTIKNGVSLWALLGNLVIGGIPGYIIDAATGSFGAYYQDVYEVDLVSLEEQEHEPQEQEPLLEPEQKAPATEDGSTDQSLEVP